MTTHIGLLLHAYQPPTQQSHIIQTVFQESYLPFISILEEHKKNAVLSLDLAQSLGERLPREFIRRIRELYRSGNLELVTTAAYHYLLPLVPREAVRRQLALQNGFYRTNLVGADSMPGIFLPECAYAPRLPRVFRQYGFHWCIADDGPSTFVNSGLPPHARVPQSVILEVDGCGVLLRSRYWSDRISSNNYCCGGHFLLELLDGQEKWRRERNEKNDTYVVLAVDLETFGHHHKGAVQKFLPSFFETAHQQPHRCQIVPLHAIFERFPKVKGRVPAGSWAMSKNDFTNNIPYSLWNHPKNPYHRAWNEFMQIALGAGHRASSPRIEKLLDRAFYSCSPWQYAYGKKDIAAWCFPMFKEIAAHFPDRKQKLRLRALLENMQRAIA